MTFSKFTRELASLIGVSAGLAGASQAQSMLYNFNGDKANDRLGAAVANAGDFNNDGFDDVVVGAPEDFNVFLAMEGFVRVYSGKDGLVLGTFDGAHTQDAFGRAVAGAGDVDGDGWDDIVVGANYAGTVVNQAGLVTVISGQTHAALYQISGLASGEQLGWSVSGCGDVDGDGRADFMAGAPTANNNMGIVRVYSGASGLVLHTFTGTVSNGRLGYSLSEVGDVNGDGHADLLVGSLFAGVHIYSGLNGNVLKHWTGAANNDIYGKSVSGIADMDGDGKGDVVIGATQEDPLAGNPLPGFLHVRSSVSGALLLTVSGATPAHRFASSVSDAGDWNGDSKPDIVVGVDPANAALPEYSHIISGLNGSILATFVGDSSSDGMGSDVAGLGDVNGDGKVDVVVGAAQNSPSGIASGRARVYSSNVVSCGGINNYCVAAPNSVSAQGMGIAGVGTASVSSLFFLNASGGPAGQFGVCFYGPNQVNLPFGDGTRCVGGQLIRLPPVQIGSGGTANMLLNFGSLPVPITANSTWNFQYWYRDPAAGGTGFNLTDGLHVSFCP